MAQRWGNIVAETAMAAGFALLYGITLFAAFRRWLPVRFLPLVLLLLFIVDVGRVNAKFMLLVNVPEKARDVRSPVIDFLARDSKEYRVLPMGGDPMPYAANRIPVLFTSRPVQQQRWQEFLDAFTLGGVMPDLLNVKYLVLPGDQYEQEKGMYGAKYRVAFQSPDRSEVVLENLTVLPKGWLVPAAAVIGDPQQTLALLQSPGFDPRRVALVESPPPIPLADPRASVAGAPGTVSVTRYEGEHIDLTAETPRNALLVLGEKYAKGWRATVDGSPAVIYPVDRILRGVYLTPGRHGVTFTFDPASFKVGKYLTLASFALFTLVLLREFFLRRRKAEG